jgi:glutamine amidotransferase
MSQSITVALIDYGSGNLRSVAKAFERIARDEDLKASITVTRDPDFIKKASHVVLPGVGSFADCYSGLKQCEGMIEAIDLHSLKKGNPFLGICVGMQLLADYGKEHGLHEGLGWIAGEIIPLKKSSETIKIPHMGWNTISIEQPHCLLKNISDNEHVYFVHSYHFKLNDQKNLFASTEHGQKIAAMIAKGTVIGTQFHPEKSQKVGLTFLSNFLKWCP